MTIDVTTNVQVAIAGAQVIQSSTSYPSGAVETISIEIAAGAADQEVLVQPGPATAVLLIALHAETGDQSLSYKPSLAAAPIILNGAHVYNGPSMVALLGSNPNTLYFSNSNTNAAIIKIFVGRTP